jgi:hypothetical protein
MRLGVVRRLRPRLISASLSSSSKASRRRFLALRDGAQGAGGGVRAAVLGGGVCLGETGRAALCDRGERRGVSIGRGLCRRWALERRDGGEGDPLRRDCRARQVPRRPLPDANPSDGGGVEKRRVGVKRDDRRTSHGRADGSNMIVEDRR